MAYADGHNHSPLAVRTQGLVKAYGGFKAVDSLNLQVPDGGIYGLLGPNGAGKSTTMKLLLGLTKPTAGNMWLLGQQVGNNSPIQPGRVGSMIEGPSFYPSLSGLDNCRMVADYLGLPVPTATGALAKMELQGCEKKKAGTYSLGMKQRLGIAMALISQPELLLLDEPTNGLDAEAVVEVRQMIMDLAASEGVTVIISSHILSEIEKMAPVVGIIADGHLLYQGSLEDTRTAVKALRSEKDPKNDPLQSVGERHSWDDITPVLDHARHVGISIALTETGRRPQDPGQANLAFTVTREAVTNTLRHGQEVNRIVVSWDHNSQGGIDITVRDDGRLLNHDVDNANGNGTGLARLRAEVQARCGSFSSGPGPDGWTLQARIPSLGGPAANNTSKEEHA